jgi:VanZ family protein
MPGTTAFAPASAPVQTHAAKTSNLNLQFARHRVDCLMGDEGEMIVKRRRIAAAAIQTVAWASAIALAPLSLLPAVHVPRTHVGGHLEHILAYAGTALFVAMATSERGILRIDLALVAYAGVLEFLQRYSLGRTSSLRDFMYSAGGVVLGCAVVALSRQLAAARR